MYQTAESKNLTSNNSVSSQSCSSHRQQLHPTGYPHFDKVPATQSFLISRKHKLKRLVAAALLTVFFGVTPETRGQSTMKPYQINNSLVILSAPAGNTPVDISIRPTFIRRIRLRNTFTVTIDGTNWTFDNVQNISITLSGGRNSISVEDVDLEGTLDIQVGDGRDYVAVANSIVEGDINLQMGNGYNRLSLGDTVIFGQLSYDGGLGPDQLNAPFSGGTTSQADCVVLGDVVYEDLGGDDRIELNRFQISGNLLIDLGTGNDSVRVTSSDSGGSYPVQGRSTSVGGDCVIDHFGGNLTATIEDTKLDHNFVLFSTGESSRVSLRSRRTGAQWSPMSVGANMIFFTDTQRSRTEMSGLQQDQGVFQLLGTEGEDFVDIRNSGLQPVHINLGDGKDSLYIESTTVKQSVTLNGGSSDNDTGNALRLDVPQRKVSGFESGNLAP